MNFILEAVLSGTNELGLFSREVTQSPFLNNSQEFTDIAVKSFASLILVIILILIIYFLLSKHKKMIQSSENFKILDFMILEPKKTLYLMDIYGKILIVATTEQNINIITEITDKNKCDSLRLLDTPEEKNFSKIFSRKVNSREKNIEKLKRQLEKIGKKD